MEIEIKEKIDSLEITKNCKENRRIFRKRKNIFLKEVE